jgi:hypothetical protein
MGRKKKDQKKGGGARKYGRNRKPIQYPLMPDGMTRSQAFAWYEKRYGPLSESEQQVRGRHAKS